MYTRLFLMKKCVLYNNISRTNDHDDNNNNNDDGDDDDNYE